MKMSDGKPKIDIVGAFMVVGMLAMKNAVTEDEVISDPERLAPRREEEQASFDVIEEFLKIHLYGGCTACE